MVPELVVTAASGGVHVVTVAGEVDMATVPRLRSEIVRLIASFDDPPLVVLDLCGVDLLDTSGMAVLLEAIKRCSLRNGAVALARAEPQVERELALTGMLRILPVHPTVEAAVGSIARGQP